jgi:cysteinyl-tRNA synthetase
MSKSAGNGFLPGELFTGNHPLLAKGYSPMGVRFFMLQTHYRSTLDFSNDALQASEKGYAKLISAIKTIDKLQASAASTVNIDELKIACYDAMNDDFNSPILIANLFEAVRIINSTFDGKETLTQEDIEKLKTLMHQFVFDVMGLKNEESAGNNKALEGVMEMLIGMRAKAKIAKDFATSDAIRDSLIKNGIIIKDTKEGTDWQLE